MNGLEQRVRSAFDALEPPADLKARTLEAAHSAAAANADVPASSPVQERTGEARPAPASADVATDAPPAVAAVAACRPRRASVGRRIGFALAACLILCAVGVFGVRMYTEETAFVGIDVNPSLELGLNRFDIVVSERSFNEDGERLLASAPVVGKTYEDAVAALTDSDEFRAYADNGAFVEISVSSSDARQATALQTQSDACLRELPCEGSCHAVDSAERAAASEAGMGVGRYQAALELMELDSAVTLDDCRQMSMRELRDRIAELSGEGGAGGEGGRASGNGQGHGYGGGNGQGGGHHAGNGKGRGHSSS